MLFLCVHVFIYTPITQEEYNLCPTIKIVNLYLLKKIALEFVLLHQLNLRIELALWHIILSPIHWNLKYIECSVLNPH